MHSQLSSTTIAQLAPLLGSLARLVAEGSRLSAEEYEVLLDGVGLDTDSAVLDEVQRWGRLLIKLHTQPTSTLRRVTAEALMLRGLPEATVLLAVAAVADTPASVSQPRLRVTPERLDFGTLAAAAPVTATFGITGGAGHIVVESEYVRVTPLQFGPGATRVQVEVLPLAGGLLWTTLKLVTASASLEVPVMAQWAQAITPMATHEAGQSPDTKNVSFPLWASVQPANNNRYLPIYLLLDVSTSMAGAPVEALMMGLEGLQAEITSDPYARDTARIGIILFGETAVSATAGLVSVHELPRALVTVRQSLHLVSRRLWSDGAININRLDLAFQKLSESLHKDVQLPMRTAGGELIKGDYSPRALVMLGSEPTDENGRPSEVWQIERANLLENRKPKLAEIVARGCGSTIDDKLLHSISTSDASPMQNSVPVIFTLFTYQTQ